MHGEQLPGDPGWSNESAQAASPPKTASYISRFAAPPPVPISKKDRARATMAMHRLTGETGELDLQALNDENEEDKPKKPFKERWQAGDFTVVPSDNWVLDVWDVLVIIALLITAVILPVESAFFYTPPTCIHILNEVVNVIFVMDILVTFNVAFSSEKMVTGDDDKYEKRPAKIAEKYMALPFSENMTAGWFWPDVFTIIPWDRFPKFREAKYTRFVRILRLVRMLRLVRVIKLGKRWQTSSGASFKLITVLKCFGATVLLLHWMTCVWAAIGLHSEAVDPHAATWILAHGHTDQGLLQDYFDALYMCAVVITSVGFGDMPPENVFEMHAGIISIFIMGLTWAWVEANVVAVITNMDVFHTKFSSTMDDLNYLMSSANCNFSLKFRVRKHVHESKLVQRRRHFQDAIRWMSEGLQGEFAGHAGVEKILLDIWYFRKMPKPVMIDLCDEFLGNFYSPDEVLLNRNILLVIERGSCVKNGTILGKDNVLGEDFILYSEYLRDSACPRTLTFLQVLELHRDSLRNTCLKFPDFDLQIRKAQCKLALWRGFIIAADKKQRAFRKQQEAQQKKGGKPSVGGRKSMWDAKFFSGGTQLDKFSASVHRKFHKGWVESMCRPSASTAANTVLLLDTLEKLRLDAEAFENEAQTSWEAVEAKLDALNTAVQQFAHGVEIFAKEVEKTISKKPQEQAKSPSRSPSQSPKEAMQRASACSVGTNTAPMAEHTVSISSTTHHHSVP